MQNIFCKILITAVISNVVVTHELTIYEIFSCTVIIFSSSCFIAGDSHVKIICLYIAVFNEHDILHFRDDAHLPKHYPIKKP